MSKRTTGAKRTKGLGDITEDPITTSEVGVTDLDPKEFFDEE